MHIHFSKIPSLCWEFQFSVSCLWSVVRLSTLSQELQCVGFRRMFTCSPIVFAHADVTPPVGLQYLYALNPSCLGEPCPTQPKQVKTIPTIEVGKEGLEAFIVWINVNGFPTTKKWTYVQMKDRSVECGLLTYVQCEFRHQNTRSGWGPWPQPEHHWKGYQSIQWRPWNPAVLWQRKNGSARRKNCRTRLNDANLEPWVRNCVPGGQPLPQPT